ncbi:general transcription factor II-I repeat domain-containing protein 2 [Trichonephila clavipes]|nr:general transcription factor II-I repeat domain-containing protein 2 [Trichonephila clavipes]
MARRNSECYQHDEILKTEINTEQEDETRAGFRVALEIAKRGKPFTEGKMIEECVIAVSEEMCSEKVESTGVSDTHMVLIFIREINKSYEVYEEILDSFRCTTTGNIILGELTMPLTKRAFD